MTNEQQIRYDHALSIAEKTGFTKAQIDEMAPVAALVLEKAWDGFVVLEKAVPERKDYGDMLLELTRPLSVEDDLGMLVVSLLLTYVSHEYYKEHNIDETIYLASMRDIWVWTQTCIENRHHLGMYQYSWIRNFLTAQIVRLHRLEFHEVEFHGEPYTACGVTVKKGDTVINTHIPADGHMDPADVDESFRQAYKYFGKTGLAPIVCESWLLYPKNRLFCAPTSRMVSFLDHFTIIDSGDLPDSHDKWRVFGHLPDYTPENLPEKTPLQKQLKAHLASGGTMGYGYGIFLHDGEKRVDG